jgi:Divergent InlB B-repeat domain
MPKQHACECAVCRRALAAPVDEMIFLKTVVPLAISSEHLDPNGADPGSPKGLSEAIARAVETEMPPTPAPDVGSLLGAVSITAKPDDPTAQKLLTAVQAAASEHAKTLQDEVVQQQRQAAFDRLPDTSIAKAPSGAAALRRLAEQVRTRYNLFVPGQSRPAEPRRAPRLQSFDTLRIMYLERLRKRGLGHTVKRAPFDEVCVVPGGTVSFSHQAFAQRELSQEDIFSAEESHESSITSAITSTLADEYASEHSKETSWKISPSFSATFKPEDVPLELTAELSGEYGASSTNTASMKQSAERTQSITQTAAAKLTSSYKTTVTVSQTQSDTLTSAVTFANASDEVKRYLFYTMHSVNAMSLERYGVRMVWSPCIADPGRDIRDIEPGQAAFSKEIKAIHDKWNAMQPPAELGSPPGNQTVCSSWSGQQTGGLTGKSYDDQVSIPIPSGYVFGNAYIDTTDVTQNGPGVSIDSQPAAGATGVADFTIHVGLKGALLDKNREKVNYHVCIVAIPGPELMGQWNTTVQTWRDQQAQKEIDAFLATKQDQIKNLDATAWPPSELMRRIIADYFGDPATYASCEIVEMLERVFDWKNLSWSLKSPWWKPNAPVDGLQSLATTFENASFADCYLPLAVGYEEEAIAFLVAVGVIPSQQPLLDDIQYYLDDMRQNVEPLFQRVYVPGPADPIEIDGPCDILLTEIGENPWRHTYESQLKFQVLDRWILTLPTPGVHYEEIESLCKGSHDDDAHPADVELDVVTEPAGLQVRIGDGEFAAAPVKAQVATGTSQTIAAIDRQTKDGIGYAFTGWSNGESSAKTTVVPSSGRTVTGHFRPAAFAVDTTVSGPGGSISVRPPTGAPGFPLGWYAPGTHVTISANPLDGHVVGAVHIVADGKDTVVTSKDVPLVVNGPVKVQATFAPANEPAVTISTISAASAGDAAGISQSKLFFTNHADVPAFGLQVTAVSFKTTAGSGDVTLVDALPIDFGDVPANGQSAVKAMSYRIPSGVTTFDMILSVSLKDPSGATIATQLTTSQTRP